MVKGGRTQRIDGTEDGISLDVRSAAPVYSTSYNRYVLAILTVVYTLNQMDQGLIALLLQPIKEDLHLTDGQMGFVTGIAFGLFYATLGVPLGRWSDKGDRPKIAALAIGLWGATVMACVLVRTFSQLIVVRVAAGVGESGCMPATYSLLGDYFAAPKDRTKAMTIYMIAGPASALLSFIVGGWLNQHWGWRVAFCVMGIPGLVMAFIVFISIREPRRFQANAKAQSVPSGSVRDVVAEMWRQRSCRHLSIAIILLFTMGLGLSPWYAAFMIRSHGMDTGALGLWMGLIFGIAGLFGVLCGGYVAARWFADNEKAQMRTSALVVGAAAPSLAFFLFLPTQRGALLALVVPTVVCNFFFGPAFSLLQRLVADQMRATTVAMVMLFANLIGMGIGPQLVGLISDMLAPRFGIDSLRYSMLLMSSIALWSGYHFWCVGRTVGRDLCASNTLSRVVAIREPVCP